MALPSFARSRRAYGLRDSVAPSSLARRMVAEGLRQIRARRYTEAISKLEKAIRLDGASAEAFHQLGDAYYLRSFQEGAPERDREDSQAAVDAYRTALALDLRGEAIPDKFLIYHGLGQCYDALGRREDALSAFKAAALANPTNPMPHLYAANIRLRMGDEAMAAANFKTSVRRAYRARALPALAKLVRSDPAFADLMSLPANRALLGAYEQSAGTGGEVGAEERLSAAQPAPAPATYAEPAREIRPPFAAPEVRDSVRAEAAPRAIERAPEDSEASRLLELAGNAFGAQRPGDALGLYKAALEADARRASLDVVQRSLVYERMGACYRQLGLWSQALTALEHAVELAPLDSEAHYQISLCHAVEGKLALALASLNKALDSAPSAGELRKLVLLARTDPELEPARDLPQFSEILRAHADRLPGGR